MGTKIGTKMDTKMGSTNACTHYCFDGQYRTAVCTVAVMNALDSPYGYVGTALRVHVDSGFDVLPRHLQAYSRFLRNMYLEALRALESVWMEFVADNDPILFSNIN
jgi:hypothetical protein